MEDTAMACKRSAAIASFAVGAITIHRSFAQDYKIDRNTLHGGGGMSNTQGAYALYGTIG